jgi:hypothetical protein
MATNEWLDENPGMTFLDAVYLIPKDDIREVFPEASEEEILAAWEKSQELLNFCIADVPVPFEPDALPRLLEATHERAKERFPEFSDLTLELMMGKVHHYLTA